MSHQKALKKLIIQNNTKEFQSYYIFNNLNVDEDVNDSSFDLLNYALDHQANDAIVLFILSQYTHCDYETSQHQIPIYLALAYRRIRIAKALMDQRHADIHRIHSSGDNLLLYLYKQGQLNPCNLRFALDHQVDINWKDRLGKKLLYYFIHQDDTDFVRRVLHYFLYDTPFLLQLLHFYQRQEPISTAQLQSLLAGPARHLSLSQSFYFSAIKNGNQTILEELFRCDERALSFSTTTSSKPPLKTTPPMTPTSENSNLTHPNPTTANVTSATLRPESSNLTHPNAATSATPTPSNPSYSNVSSPSLSPSSVHPSFSSHSTLPSPSITPSHTPAFTHSVSPTLSYTPSPFSLPSSSIVNKYEMLIRSTINNHFHLVRYFVEEKGAEVNQRNNKGDTALMIASLKGYLPIVTYLLDHGAEVNIQNKRNYTALIYAAEKNHDEIVETLLHHHASINAQEKDGNTALILASLFGHEATVRRLLQHHAEVRLKNYHGWSALHSATLYHHLNVVKVLLEEPLKINHDESNVNRDPEHPKAMDLEGEQPQVYHDSMENTNIHEKETMTMEMEMENLIDINDTQDKDINLIDINDTQDKGMTALHLAAEHGQDDLVHYLLEKGASLHQANPFTGSTALMLAAAQGHPTTVQQLVEAGAEVEAIDRKGDTALMLAVYHGHLDVVQYLVEKAGANLFVFNYPQAYPVFYAVVRQDEALLTYLLSKGAEAERPEGSGWTPLLMATHLQNIRIMTCLLQHGVSVHSVQEQDGGRTSLMIAVENHQMEAVKLLVEYGGSASLLPRDHQGHTACVLAAYYDEPEMVKFFLENHSGWETRRPDLISSYLVALAKGNQKVINYLSYYLSQHNIKF